MSIPVRRLDVISKNTQDILNNLRAQTKAQPVSTPQNTVGNNRFILFSEAKKSGRFEFAGMGIYKEADTDMSVGRIWKKESFKNPNTGQMEEWLVVYTTDDDEVVKMVADQQLSSLHTTAANPKPEDIPLAEGIKSKNISMDETGGSGKATVTIDFTDSAKGLDFYQNNVPSGGAPASSTVLPEEAKGVQEAPKEEIAEQTIPNNIPTPPVQTSSNKGNVKRAWSVDTEPGSRTYQHNSEDLHQSLMNDAYDSWRSNPEMASSSREDFLNGLNSLSRAAVILGNLHYQVGNGGFEQWDYNGYSAQGEEAVEFLEQVGSPTAVKAAEIVSDVLDILDEKHEAEQVVNNYENGYDVYTGDYDEAQANLEAIDRRLDVLDNLYYDLDGDTGIDDGNGDLVSQLLLDINAWLHEQKARGDMFANTSLLPSKPSIQAISSSGKQGVYAYRLQYPNGLRRFSYVNNSGQEIKLPWKNEVRVGSIVELPDTGDEVRLLGYKDVKLASDRSIVDHLVSQAVDISDEIPPMTWQQDQPAETGSIPPGNLSDDGIDTGEAQPAEPGKDQVLYDSTDAKQPKFQTTIDPNDNSVSVKFLEDDELAALNDAIGEGPQLPEGVAPAGAKPENEQAQESQQNPASQGGVAPEVPVDY